MSVVLEFKPRKDEPERYTLSCNECYSQGFRFVANSEDSKEYTIECYNCATSFKMLKGTWKDEV